MGSKLEIFTVILDPSILNYPYLCNDIVEKTTDEEGNLVYHMTCTEIDEGGNYLSATVSIPPNGEPRKILLRHSFVVAVLEAVSLQSQPGFVHQENNE